MAGRNGVPGVIVMLRVEMAWKVVLNGATGHAITQKILTVGAALEI